MTTTSFACTTRDGIVLNGRSWHPAGEPWCRIALVHGLGDHIGRYEQWAGRFVEEGVAVVGVDLRGHGLSPGRRGASRSLHNLLLDCEALVGMAGSSEVPLVLYGHSLGGLLVLEYLRQVGADGVAAAVLTSPWLALAFPPPPLKAWVAAHAARWLPGVTVRSGLRAETMGRSDTVASAYRNDPLVHGRISFGLFAGALGASRYWAHEAASLPVPALLMHGSGDEVTDCRASEQLASRLQGDRMGWRLWPDACHELHHDPLADAVFHAVLEWLHAIMGRAAPIPLPPSV